MKLHVIKGGVHAPAAPADSCPHCKHASHRGEACMVPVGVDLRDHCCCYPLDQRKRPSKEPTR